MRALGPYMKALSNISQIRTETLAALTVSLALVPEAVAFAFVAGVDPLVGMYAAFIIGFVTSLVGGRPGVLHGAMSYLLQDSDGQVAPAHSISAGLDYPGVGPEHSYLMDTGRASYASVTDEEALAAFHRLSDLEGITPALESAHAGAHVLDIAEQYREGRPLLVCLSGRGDKDVAYVARMEEGEHYL